MFTPKPLSFDLRDIRQKLYLPKPRTYYLKLIFSYSGASLWNDLPEKLFTTESLGIFKKSINNWFSESNPHTALICKPVNRNFTWYIFLLLYGKVNPSVLIGSYLVRISPYEPFPWKRSSAVYFLFSKAGKFKTSMARVPYNKPLTNLASSSRNGEYWPSVRTATTSGQYSPVRPSRPVTRRLILDEVGTNILICQW